MNVELDDDDDQLTRQRAIDAAVAVAAAAAAHQDHEAAAQRLQQQQQQQQQNEVPQEQLKHQDQNQLHDLGSQQPMNIVLQGLTETDVQSVNAYTTTPPPASSLGLDSKDNGVDLTAKMEDQDHTFADTSMQYNSDAPEQNGVNGETSDNEDRRGGAKNRPHVHHTKRRKINTCLPCKRRKVKCDREKPYCGECKKHDFPPSECTWSAAIVDATPLAASSQQAAPSFLASSAIVEAPAASSSSGQQWFEMPGAPWANFAPLPMDHSNQTLMGRIAELEAIVATVKGGGDETNEEARRDNEQWVADRSGLSEAAHDMAADALAMIAQHQAPLGVPFSTLLPSRDQSFYKAKRLLPMISNNGGVNDPLHFEGERSNSTTREISSLLPDIETIHRLLSDFDMMQNHGLDMGISINLIIFQLKAMEEEIDAKKDLVALGLDLSFVALLFHLLATTLEFKDANEVLVNMGLTNKDVSYTFMTECQRQDSVKEGEKEREETRERDCPAGSL
ncbi:hypothetical protein CBS101457_003993 [Exobasidium rhododendri]|nr:hypothetical protein CBS101457_003993 [Exobasidium rhododendri]